MTDSLPARVDRGPPSPSVIEFRNQLANGIPYLREPYPNTTDDPNVESCRVVRLKPNLYRALILYRRPMPGGGHLLGCDSSKVLVTSWLTAHGLPTVRIFRSDL